MRQTARIIQADVVDALQSLPDNCVQLTVSDAPYGVRTGATWDQEAIAFDPALWRQVARVSVPGATLAAFGGSDTEPESCAAPSPG